MTKPAIPAEPEQPPGHPEEMRGSFTLRIGERTVLEGSGRTTPAGLISAGLAVAAITLAFGFVVRSVRSLPPHSRF